MSAGIPKFVTVNLKQLAVFKDQEEVSLETLKQKKILNVSGKAAKLPLKVHGLPPHILCRVGGLGCDY